MIPRPPELTVMPCAPALKVGSGKFGTPCRRMHSAWASAACLALAGNLWGAPLPALIRCPHALSADSYAGDCGVRLAGRLKL